MRKLIVVVLLVLFLAPAGLALALPWQCEWAAETGKLSDWLVCGVWIEIRALQQDWGEGYPQGYY